MLTVFQKYQLTKFKNSCINTSSQCRFASSSTVVAPKITKFETLEWNEARPYKSIPGPGTLSLIRGFAPGGQYHDLKLLDVHRKMRNDFGKILKFKGTFGRKDILMITSPEDYETLFRREPAWPQRRGMEVFVHYRKNMRKDVFKGVGGLLTEQDEAWYNLRSSVNPVLMHPKATKVYIPRADRISKEFVGRLKGIRDANNETPANFSEEVNRWTMESISCIALDTRLGILSDFTMDEKAKTLIKSVRSFFDLTFQVDITPPIWRYFRTPTFNKLIKVSDQLTDIVTGYVDDSIERFEKNPTADDQEAGVLEKLMKINKHTAKVMVFDMILAGADTTASGFIGVLYCLARNPIKQEKLRTEIRQALPDSGTELCAENMKNLPYLRAVIKEGLRMHPPTVNIVRSTAQDMVMQGYQVPKDTDIAISNLLVSNDDSYFPLSHEFIPERWLKGESTEASGCPRTKTAQPFVNLPFGYGPRSCVGRRFAEMLIEVLITRMVREFSIEWHYDEMKFQSGLANVPVGDIKFRLIYIK